MTRLLAPKHRNRKGTGSDGQWSAELGSTCAASAQSGDALTWEEADDLNFIRSISPLKTCQKHPSDLLYVYIININD